MVWLSVFTLIIFSLPTDLISDLGLTPWLRLDFADECWFIYNISSTVVLVSFPTSLIITFRSPLSLLSLTIILVVGNPILGSLSPNNELLSLLWRPNWLAKPAVKPPALLRKVIIGMQLNLNFRSFLNKIFSTMLLPSNWILISVPF